MYKNGDLCPICESGHLSEKIERKNLDFKGIPFVVENFVSYQCDICGEGIISETTEIEIEKIGEVF